MFSTHKNIIVVVGTTGVGKTKLGVDLAKQFSGEVINCDVMQMYKGLEVATAKATQEERQGIPHHLMSFLEPHETFSPHEFRKLADAKINEISERGKMPIVVGGTMYYVQGLLWDHLIEQGGTCHQPGETVDDQVEHDKASTEEEEESSTSSTSSTASTASTASTSSKSKPNSSSTSSLWEKLQRVDPEMAAELHPNNVRKIARSLEIYKTSGGVTHTELLRQQKESGGGIANLDVSRYPNACILWCRCDKDVLKQRLDDRVKTMMSNGLREEIVELQTNAMKKSVSSSSNSMSNETAVVPYDVTRGVYQSIGFKEFQEYLTLVRTNNVKQQDNTKHTTKDTQDGTTIELNAALERGIEQLKISTKRYARKQLAWIRNRWIAKQVPVHVLDTTDVLEWQNKVDAVAQSVVRASFGVTGCVGTERSAKDRRVKQLSLKESRRFQMEHAEIQQIKSEKSAKKRKYRESLKARKIEENAKRRKAAEHARAESQEQKENKE